MILDLSSRSVKEVKKLYDKVRESVNQFIRDNEYTVMFTISGGILPLHAIEEMGYSRSYEADGFFPE